MSNFNFLENEWKSLYKNATTAEKSVNSDPSTSALKSRVCIEETVSETKKLGFYIKDYLPFVNRLEVRNLKEMDEALFAFGQFLNTNNQKELMQLNP